ncbi:hypothetical protein Ping_1540 [Psychromonas ingrahamii 37]|uniref:STAS/SEC14 domain-containing protein n=1 Tax=Psychromonas ingrahamii (strain DSM 17664 / CCUG 51855 / 37) TaxID=357804 RepID=A1SV34_PSYIN|nr:STAS/SEC14 domain-containing protein [Psychromonas ingrahamii]ABM03349.1 hypothetical protein Ping_1540 [Psychromonas ingrahamii 37]
MINAKLMRNDGILIVEPVDKLEKKDFKQVALLVNPYLEKHAVLNGILIDAESFPGWENFAGLVSHLRFINQYEKKVKRIAAVTDIGILSILPKIVKHFVSAEVRHFSYKERELALSWLQTDGAG